MKAHHENGPSLLCKPPPARIRTLPIVLWDRQERNRTQDARQSEGRQSCVWWCADKKQDVHKLTRVGGFTPSYFAPPERCHFVRTFFNFSNSNVIIISTTTAAAATTVRVTIITKTAVDTTRTRTRTEVAATVLSSSNSNSNKQYQR